LGSFHFQGEAQLNAIQAGQPEQEELTPYERAASQDESGHINPIQLALFRHAEAKSAVFGFANAHGR
jgi:hypothetical protein